MRRILTALRDKIASLRPRRQVLVPAPVRRPAAQRGLTLVEMLVTVAITLIMMAAVVNVFASIGQGVQHRRATIEMSNQLRIARTLLAQDLARTTATTLPPRDPSSGEGYLELIEGTRSDGSPTRIDDGLPPNSEEIDYTGNSEMAPTDPSTLPVGRFASDVEAVPPGNHFTGMSGLGDYDDVLAFTARSDDAPFVGRFGPLTIKSQEAEIIWYAVENPAVPTDHPLYLGEPGMRTVYRRVLLVAPWVDANPALSTSLTSIATSLGVGINDGTDPEIWRKFYRNFDLSIRVDPETGRWVPNTLSDLTKRENRFAHLGAFPHTMDVRRIRHSDPAVYDDTVNANQKSQTPLVPFGTIMEYDAAIVKSLGGLNTSDTRLGEDVVLTNVLAFDMRVYDPSAPIYALVSGGAIVSGAVVEPSDFGLHSPGTLVGSGAYADLSYTGGELFGVSPTLPSGHGFVDVQKFHIRATYDTWSFHYEYDGIDQDRDDLIDEGTNGVDDPTASGTRINGVDDLGERETLPPYLTPLRGMEVKLRIYEPDSRVVREVSVKQNFTPQ